LVGIDSLDLDVAVDATVDVVVEGIEPLSRVTIDVKPRRINPGRGVIMVTIFGWALFDVHDLDTTTLAFGPAEAAPVRERRRDRNRDGFTDLVTIYRTRDTGIVAGDTEVCLVAQTLGLELVVGCDMIRTRKRHDRERDHLIPRTAGRS
jgi:hypothetical protein